MEIWLLWLQPWNAVDIKLGSGELTILISVINFVLIEKHVKALSKLPETVQVSFEWKLHVAANLHFYSTLFHMYLRSVKI